jgi:hypothetical protein
MREIDALMTPDLARGVVFESHPELVFAVLSGAPAIHKKSTPEGREERLALLGTEGLPKRCSSRIRSARSACAPDDLVDAGLCVLTAMRIAEGRRYVCPKTRRLTGKAAHGDPRLRLAPSAAARYRTGMSTDIHGHARAGLRAGARGLRAEFHRARRAGRGLQPDPERRGSG